MSEKSHILLIRLKSIGDVVLTLPALSVLRQNFPDSRITFLTSRENAPLMRGFANVDDVIAIDRAALRTGNPFKVLPEILGLLKRLRAGDFSLVVDLQGYGESAWLTRLTGARQRWGVINKPGRRWAYTQTADRRGDIHVAEMYLELLRKCGLDDTAAQNQFVLPTDARDEARRFLANCGVSPDKPILFLQPFTSSPKKNWPLINYLGLARHWRERGWQVIFGGGPADLASLKPAQAEKFTVSAGVPLLVTAGLMQLSGMIIGGDTGALHLAVAQGKRVIMLMNHDWAGKPHPFRHHDWALVPPVNRQIETLQVEQVIAASEGIIG